MRIQFIRNVVLGPQIKKLSESHRKLDFST